MAIPGGTFSMGCVSDDPHCSGHDGDYAESPVHEVAIAPFEMTRTEITQYQYWKVTGLEPSFHPRCANCPVEHMAEHHHDAKAFCEAIGGRLPSEAEWEYAARAGTETRYICGDDPACLDEVAWHAASTEALDPERVRHPQPVGQKAPNAFGLFDMAGNIQEWTADCSHEDYVGAPNDGSPWMAEGGGDCTMHVFRGSSYNTELGGHLEGWMTRASGRYWDRPSDIRGIADGFRCARDLAE